MCICVVRSSWCLFFVRAKTNTSSVFVISFYVIFVYEMLVDVYCETQVVVVVALQRQAFLPSIDLSFAYYLLLLKKLPTIDKNIVKAHAL